MIAPSQKVVAVEREQHFGWNESKAPSDEQAGMDILLKRKADHEKESGLPDVVDSSCWIGQSIQRMMLGKQRMFSDRRCLLFIIRWILIRAVTKKFVPGIRVKIRKFINGTCDSGKPVIKNDMVLRSNGTSLRV